MKPRLLLPIFALLFLATPTLAVDESKLEAIPARMKEFVDKNEVPGVVTLLATRDKILHTSAVGVANLETSAPMREGTIFWIASMTKPVTGAAVLALQDEGKLSVDDPIAKYIPDLKD